MTTKRPVYTYLREPAFNKEKELKRIEKAFVKVDKNIELLNKKAKSMGFYIDVSESREKEKVLGRMYPYLHNTSRTINTYPLKDTINQIEYEYYNRVQTALYSVGFVSINEKTKVVKCKKRYDFGTIDLYYLNRVAEFENNLNNTDKASDSIETLKEYNNLNVEFKFKSDSDYETFKALVFYGNEKTKYIINNASDSLISKYKELKKQPHTNEIYPLYEFARENKDLRPQEPINRHLINKVWGC